MKPFYSLIVSLTSILINFCSIFNSKAKGFLDGRKNTHKIIRDFKLKGTNSLGLSVIWFHCASLGEFEQSRPLIEKVKKFLPEYKIAISFFSSSGYNVKKNYELADWTGFLPMDKKKEINFLINFLNPKILILVKNEFWPNLLYCMKEKKIPIISISCNFRSKQFFFSPWAVWFLKAIKTINHFYTSDIETKKILKKKNINNTTMVGDTRIDRVLNILNKKKEFKIINDFINNEDCWIAGSTWKEDYSLFTDYIHSKKSPKVIIAPHDCSAESISAITKKLNIPYSLWSSYSFKGDHSKKVLIIDTIGVLKYTYKYAKWAYIGGGMGGNGLHNILEAAVYDIPIIIGKNFFDFPEATDLIKYGTCFSVSSDIEFEKVTQLISNDIKRKPINNYDFIKKQEGATDKIFSGLKKILVEA